MKNGLPSEPSEMPMDLRSLADPAPVIAMIAAVASSAFLNIIDSLCAYS